MFSPKLSCLVAFISLNVFFCTGFAATLTVPTDSATIQGAIDLAADGDTVVVSPGVYVENIDFLGKNITVTSTDPDDPAIVEATVIDGGGNGSVVTFANGEGPEAVLAGLTITGGSGTLLPDFSEDIIWGAGIFCNNASPTIRQNVIYNNSSPMGDGDSAGYGGGIACMMSEAIITRNHIEFNDCFAGAGIMIYVGQVKAANNVIHDNTAAVGGGVVLLLGGEMVHNTIRNNVADIAGNVYAATQEGYPIRIVNNIMVDAAGGGGIYCEEFNQYTSIRYNDVWNNAGGNYVEFADQTGTNGNISVNPGLIDGIHISDASFCYEAGDPDFVPYPWQRDIDGQMPVMHMRPDIGADEVSGNARPVADAGPDQFFNTIPEVVVLDGSGSYDFDENDTLTYTWTQTGGPDVTLLDADTDGSSFVPAVEDVYVFELTVSDGELTSNSDQVQIAVGNRPPVANAGQDTPVQLGSRVQLDGSSSYDPDPDDVLSFSWTQTAGPAVELDDPNSPSPVFDCVVDGMYVFELVVSDGYKQSLPDTVELVTIDMTVNQQDFDFRNIGTYAHYGDVSGDRVVYGVGSACDVTWQYRYKDLRTGQVTSHGINLIQPKIDGDLVVWMNYGNGWGKPWYHEPSNANVFVRNVKTNAQKTLRKWSWSDSYGHPVVSGTKVVWIEHHGLDPRPTGSGEANNWWNTPYSVAGADVRNWDNPKYFTIAENVGRHDPYPCHTYGEDFDDVLDICGDIVVWEGNGDIYGADISDLDNIEVFVICDAPGRQYDPAISGSTVVWTDERNDSGDIYGADISDREHIRIFEVARFGGTQQQAALSGSLLVYVNGNEYGGQIKFVCLTKQYGAIEVPVEGDYFGTGPAVDGDVVIWQSSTYGEALGISLKLTYSIGNGPVENVDTAQKYDYIQHAIEEARSGEMVVADPGIYRENINFNGKNLIVTSAEDVGWNAVASTVIQGMGSGSVVTFNGTEDETCVLEGFTITGGYSTTPGGGICGNDSLATVRNCVFRNNTVIDGPGGGIWGIQGTISCCIFKNNHGKAGGGLAKCSGVVSNCLIVNNIAETYGSALHNCDGLVRNCTLVDDSNSLTSLIHISDGVIENCIMQFATGTVFSNSTAITQYCCWPEATGEGDINAEPKFVDPNHGNYRLQSDSPCINAVNPSYVPEPNETDLDGRPRMITSAVDMGAFEFNHCPVADAGIDQTVYAWVDGWADVRLDGTGSSDAEGYSLECFWYNDANEIIATGMQPDIALGIGEHVIHLVVSDGIDDSEPNFCTVTVVAPIEKTVKMLPGTLNTNSKRTRILGRIEFVGQQKPDINPNQTMLLLIEQTELQAQFQRLVWSEETNAWYLVGGFDSAAAIANIPAGNTVQMTLVCELDSGLYVYGTDTVKVK